MAGAELPGAGSTGLGLDKEDAARILCRIKMTASMTDATKTGFASTAWARRAPTTHRPRKGDQLGLVFHTHGGVRRGAGRKPKGARALVAHAARPPLDARHPAHVTLAVVRAVPYLRTQRLMQRLRRAFAGANHGHGLRIVHYAVQGAHIHLVVEAEGTRSLARGIQGLSVRIARGLNGELGRRGTVFADRYHARALPTPREARNALAYVLLNARHHAAERGLALPRLSRPDPCSSGASFDGWRPGSATGPRAPPSGEATGCSPIDAAVVPARTWLLRSGWRRHGLIDLAELPGARR